MSYESLPCGIERYQKWRSTLFVNPEASDVDDKAVYFSLRASLADKLANVTRVSGGCDGEIMRDVIRTFQKQKFFQRYQPGQRMLMNVLFTLAAKRPDVGYCQGMNYVVAALLLGRIPACYTNITTIDAAADESAPSAGNDEDSDGAPVGGAEPALALVKAAAATEIMPEALMDDAEADVFLLVAELLRADSKLDMAGMWKERIPKLKLRIYQLDRLLRWTYPHLHAHFTAIELSPEVITAQWFLTLFTYTFPVVPTVLQLWDYVFLTGWEGLFKVALSLLGSLQPKLLALDDFESIVMLMREWKREGKLIIEETVEALIARADKFVINREVLDRLQESFASEILSIALIRSQVLNSERENAQQLLLQQKEKEQGTGPGSPGPRSVISNAFLAALGHSNSASGKKLTAAAATASDSSSAAAASAEEAEGKYPSSGDASDTAMASLSLAERRKVIQKQQQKEAEIEEQLMSGAEAPVFWLLRYGAKLPEKVLQELRRIKVDLIALDHQVDVDKQLIQAKIIKACEMNRETQDEVSAAELALHEASQTAEQGKASLQAALVLARQVALEAVQLMEGPAVPSPQGSPAQSIVHPAPSDASPASSRPNSFSSPTKSLGVLTEQVASFGTYQNKGFLRGSGQSGSNSRSNSNDGRNSGDHSSSASGGGIRFPTMPWATLRKEKSTKRSDGAGATSTALSASPIAKAEQDVARGFVYDSSKERTVVAPIGSDAFTGEGAELERPRSIAVDRYSAGGTRTSGAQESEFDDNELFLERDHVSAQDLQGSDYISSGKSSPIPVKGIATAGAAGKALPPGATVITSSGGHTGGLLSTLTSSSMTWSFPVVRAIHGATGTKCPLDNPAPGGVAAGGAGASSGTSSSGAVSKSAARAHTKQMKALEKRGQWVQQQIIDIDRALEDSKRDMEFARRRLEQARVSNEETALWKNALCDQLHLLVRDSNRGRSQKLMYVAENYNI